MRILANEENQRNERHFKTGDAIHESEENEPDGKITPISLTKEEDGRTILEVMKTEGSPAVYRYTKKKDGTIETLEKGTPTDLSLTGENTGAYQKIQEETAGRILNKLLENEGYLEAIADSCAGSEEAKRAMTTLDAAARDRINRSTQKSQVMKKERDIPSREVDQAAAMYLKKHITDTGIIRLCRRGKNSRENVLASQYNRIVQNQARLDKMAGLPPGLAAYYSLYGKSLPEEMNTLEARKTMTNNLMEFMGLGEQYTEVLAWALENLDMIKFKPRAAADICRTIEAARRENPEPDQETIRILVEAAEKGPSLSVLELPEPEKKIGGMNYYETERRKRNAASWLNLVTIFSRDRTPGEEDNDLRNMKKIASRHRTDHHTGRNWDPQEDTWEMASSRY